MRWTIGDVTVTKVVELVQPLPLAGLLPAATPEALAPHAGWLAPHFLDDEGSTSLSIHSLRGAEPGPHDPRRHLRR